MSIQKGFLTIALLCTMTLLAACNLGDNAGSAKSPVNQGSNENKETALKLIDKGTVISKGNDGNRWLITSFVDKNEDSYIDAFWFTINEQTTLHNSEGQTISPEEVAVGAEVEAWSSGRIMESYPGQTNAAKLIVFDEPKVVTEDRIGQTEAVQAALQTLTKSTTASAIKSVLLDEEKDHWVVELVYRESMDEQILVHVDARTGHIVQTPVAENDAFRVFSPSAGTEANTSFTVEGEARVFEAAFSWQLEDGHNILAEGHEMAEEGAPEWGKFKFDVSYEKASQPNMMLILFVHSAKDGSVEHQLIIPLKVPEQNISYNAE